MWPTALNEYAKKGEKNTTIFSDISWDITCKNGQLVTEQYTYIK